MYYFASDVHLGAGDEPTSRRTERCFVRWLDMVSADAEAIFLVGDIFDFWFEYGKVVPKGFVRTLGKLAELTDRGIKVVFITGNHDMWSRDYLQKECGVKVVHTSRTITLGKRTIHIAHGDNLNIGDKPLLRLMNSAFRSNILRKLFSNLIHPDLALCFGQWWSGKSRKSHANETITPQSLQFLIDYARGYKQQHPDVDCLLFGHMHYPHFHSEENLDIAFLGNWSESEGSYAVSDGEGNIELKNFR
ncbi:MAG: UDP-2,3-diacylglucosamine diphosphatase [Alistipes sp.]|nr:UDP-2,3-diacylglucosamine diphosphatase [Alistipes sp.]